MFLFLLAPLTTAGAARRTGPAATSPAGAMTPAAETPIRARMMAA